MKLTFKRLGAYMQKHQANIHKPGRTTKYIIPDIMGKGMHIMMTTKLSMESTDNEDDVGRMDIENWGLTEEIEVEDDGSLDV